MPVSFNCSAGMWSNRFLGRGWDIRVLPSLWPLILLRGGLWLGFFEGGIAYFSDGQVRASYSAADGLGEGHVSDLRLDPTEQSGPPPKGG